MPVTRQVFAMRCNYGSTLNNDTDKLLMVVSATAKRLALSNECRNILSVRFNSENTSRLYTADSCKNFFVPSSLRAVPAL